jgi:hypothetical protein
MAPNIVWAAGSAGPALAIEERRPARRTPRRPRNLLPAGPGAARAARWGEEAAVQDEGEGKPRPQIENGVVAGRSTVRITAQVCPGCSSVCPRRAASSCKASQ